MRNETSRRNGQVVLGILAIVIGVLFLLDNLHIVNIGNVMRLWPIVLIVFGAVKLSDTRSPKGVMIGMGLIGAGTLMTLSRLFDFSLRAWWPLFVIGAGILLMARALGARRPLAAYALKDGGGSDSVIDISAILGGFERRISTLDFRGGEVQAIMGGCALDMRGASIEGEAVLKVFAMFGGISIKVPPDWTVIMQGTPIMGGFEEKTAVPPDASKRLVIQGVAIMGGVEVRN
ncbi:MAG: DUF5668 domain-containing protein [Massilia sp.]